jgi:hypothetical protein
MQWYYEHRNYYKHSFTVLETSDGDHLIVEKNDLGVVWYKIPHHTL